jgi:hypothetical protein
VPIFYVFNDTGVADHGAGNDALSVQWSFIHGNLIIW